MKGFLSTLDQEHTSHVKNMWQQLEQKFNLHSHHDFPNPHFSYDVTDNYDEARALDALTQIAADTPPFTITTTGIGIFTSPAPVIYIAITRSPQLSQLHQRLHNALSPLSSDTPPYYLPQNWVPHITLAQRDTSPDQLGAIIDTLRHTPTMWQITIDTLHYASDDENGRPYIHTTFKLEGKNKEL